MKRNKIVLENEPEKLLGRVFKLCNNEFDVMLDVFGDVLRFKRVEEVNERYADASYESIYDFVKVAWEYEPNEYFHKFVPANGGLGQIFTPVEIVDFMVDSTFGEAKEKHPTVLDPATGCGVFLIRAMSKYPNCLPFGVDVDLRMVRTAMVNMRMFFPHKNSWILYANALLVDISLGHKNWGFANDWNPAHWEDVLVANGSDMVFREWKEQQSTA